MNASKRCFHDLQNDHKFDYIIHTACPFMEGLNLDQNQNEVQAYIEATKALLEKCIETENTKKFVITGSASSIVGQVPKLNGAIYNDPLEWADVDLITKPNDRAKILVER